MHQAVLMHANIDESAEIRDVSDHTFKHHTGFQVDYFFDAFFILDAFEFWPGVASRFLQFFQNIHDGRQAERLAGIVGRIQRP